MIGGTGRTGRPTRS